MGGVGFVNRDEKGSDFGGKGNAGAAEGVGMLGLRGT
jgi:hypothetical protein